MKNITTKDEALAPVVAFLLLLMIVGSFFSLLNVYYIPSLKQQEEVKHLSEVEEMFCSITGDLTSLTMLQRDSSLQERISLGGGAVSFSPVTSSGTLQIEEIEFLKLIIETSTGEPTPDPIFINTTRIIYKPIGNFWVDQGYLWENGLVYVTKGSNSVGGVRSTLLEYATESDAKAKQAKEFFIKSVLMPQFLTSTSLVTYNIAADPESLFRSGNGKSGINLFQNAIARKTTIINNVTSVVLRQAKLIDPDLNDLIETWNSKIPSFDGSTSLTVEEFNIIVQVA